jgi:hypothetical protein
MPAQQGQLQILHGGEAKVLKEVPGLKNLESGTVCRHGDKLTVCFDLQKGVNELQQRN